MDWTPRQLAAAKNVRRKLDAEEFAAAAIAAQGSRKAVVQTVEDMSGE